MSALKLRMPPIWPNDAGSLPSAITRRDFLVSSASFSCYLAALLGAGSLPALAMAPPLDWRRAPFFDLPDGVLVNIRGENLRFGSSIYPFREPHKPELLLSECE